MSPRENLVTRMLWLGAVILFFGANLSVAVGTSLPELSTEWILERIHKNKIKTLEKLLEQFSQSSLQRHLLVYASESLQFASFLSPRVIVYSFDGDFIMAFNGEPGSEGYHELEILKFDHQHRKFQPELVHFDPHGIADPVPDLRPTSCTDCHQQDPRPNWDPYFHWVGFYGSEDDNYNAGAPHGDRLTTGRENEQLARFLRKKQAQVTAQSGRYRFLPEHPAQRPLLDFNSRMTCLNMKRMLRTLSDHPLSGRVWPHIKIAEVKVKDLPSDLIDGARRTFDEVKSDTDRVMRAAVARRVARHRQITGELPQGRVRDLMVSAETGRPTAQMYDLQTESGWRFLFEEILHESFRPLVTSRHMDYQMNLGSVSDIIELMEDSRVDEKTGLMVLSRAPQRRVPEPYGGFVCPRANSYFDLPIMTPREQRMLERSLWDESEFNEELEPFHLGGLGRFGAERMHGPGTSYHRRYGVVN